MPVATLPTYDEMWVHPAAVAALSEGVFSYVPAEPWDATVDYPAGAYVVDGDGAYGGYVYQAFAAAPVGTPRPTAEDQTVWQLDECAYADRLKLHTAVLSATWLLDSLTGFRLHGEETWAEDYQVNTCTIRLRQTPVKNVHDVLSVHRCNTVGGPIGDWCHVAASEISLCCGGMGQPTRFGYINDGYYSGQQYGQAPQCGCGNVVRVLYTIDSNLPPGTEAVVAWLATEYGKAISGQACALPERITSITRQGVSWTLFDPQDFYDKGFSGMGRIDNWLAPVKRTLGGTLIDPLTSRRMHAERVEPPVPVDEACVPFIDTFERPDGSLGSDWQPRSAASNLIIAGGAMVAPGPADPIHYASMTVRSFPPDQYVEFELLPGQLTATGTPNTNTACEIMVAVRIAGEIAAGITLMFVSDDYPGGEDPTLRPALIALGDTDLVPTDFAETTLFDHTVPATVRVEAVGTELRAFINGIQEGVRTVSPVGGGHGGVELHYVEPPPSQTLTPPRILSFTSGCVDTL